VHRRGLLQTTADCIDKCNANGYTVTQQKETSEYDPDTNTTALYRHLTVTPTVSCVGGCHCPHATGVALVEEETDDDKDNDEPERSVLLSSFRVALLGGLPSCTVLY
jgi:hypothetical protein